MKTDKDYKCIMVPPKRRRKLTSKTVEIVIGKVVTFEGFDEHGPNGLVAKVFVPS